DVENNALRPHTPDWFSTVCLPYSHDPAADCLKWKAALVLMFAGDRDRIALLQEWFGYSLTRSTDAQKYLVMVGEGGNGKSTVLAAIQATVGRENVSSVPLEGLEDRFSLPLTLGKLVNISADADRLGQDAEGRLKQFTSGDVMMFERKNKDPFT